MTDTVYVISGVPSLVDANPVAPTLADAITGAQTYSANASASASAAAASATAASTSAGVATAAQAAITTIEGTVVADLVQVQSDLVTANNQLTIINQIATNLIGDLGVSQSAAASAGAAAITATNASNSAASSASSATSSASTASSAATTASTSATNAASSAAAAAASVNQITSSFNDQSTTTYVVQTSDNGEILTFTNSGAVTVTLPNTMPKGFNFLAYQGGAGQVGFTAASGGALHQRLGQSHLAGQYAIGSLLVVSNVDGMSAVWILGGDTA